MNDPPTPERGAASGQAANDYTRLLRRWIWRDFVIVLIGAGLAASPAIFDYRDPAMIWSDRLTGALIAALGCAILAPRLDLLRWGVCAAGLWLFAAPLVLWAEDAAAYTVDTLVGTTVILLSVIVPTMPGRTHHRVRHLPGATVPPGWSYNPSDWIQRAPIVVMAVVGFLLSRHLAAYQLGHISAPWDPIFGDGTRRVLESDVSRAWPVSDAGLGAATYLLEALSGLMGGRARWRTMPWMVLLFVIMVAPLGIVSIVLIVLQPVAVGAWCALCLITAAAMLIMISPAVDEVLATLQFLAGARREGRPFWRTFWAGGTIEPSDSDAAAPTSRESFWKQLVGVLDLDAVPWNLLPAAAIGLWIMAAPAVLGTTGWAAASHHIGGAMVVTWSVVGFGEIVRPIRLLNLPIALAFVAGTWFLTGGTDLSRGHDVVVGLAIFATSLRRGRITRTFGGWTRWLI
jgi:hypothetical protein